MAKQRNDETTSWKSWSLVIGHWSFKKGFTLAELIVSVTITGILMLGLSTFFSSAFHNLFRIQTQTANIGRQFAVNEIIRNKFSSLDYLVKEGADYILSFNKNTKNQLPFSYIATAEVKNDEGEMEDHLAFKDVMIFNKIIDPGEAKSHVYGNSGTGELKEAVGEKIIKTFPKNFAGFVQKEDKYYIAFPNENAVKECDATCNTDWEDFSDIGGLSSPTDIATDGTNLFISDSENGRIIQYNLDTGETVPIVTGLKYPTGLAYYETTKYDEILGENVTYKYLFIAETLNHKIKKYNITSPNQFMVETVVGGGENADCDKTAKFCKLNLPTGLFADETKHELYIADSGNNRILKMSDPGIPTSLSFKFSPGGNFALDKIVFINDEWEGGKYNEEKSTLIGSNYANKVFMNPNMLTAYSVDPCKSSDTHFYVTENPRDILENGDKLQISGSVYTNNGIPSEEQCKIGENTFLTKYKINVDDTENAGGIGNNEIVYFANPTEVVVQIDDITGIGEGYQTFEIETYERGGGLKATNYHVERVGDGILGTPEDKIEVIVDDTVYLDIRFPTGVTDVYFANSGREKIVNFAGNDKADLSPIDINAFDIFDYISDFAVESISFAKFNNGKILELTINAKVDKEKTQTYKLNAVLH